MAPGQHGHCFLILLAVHADAELLGAPGVAVAHKQVKREQKGALYESQLGIAVPVRPVELFGISPEQAGIGRRQAAISQ